jgi:integration host factor subunit beta
VDRFWKKESALNLPDLATMLAEKDNLTQREAEAAVKLIFRLFSSTLKKGDRIEIRGFGSFVMRSYKTYNGRNPKTGMQLEIQPKRLPYFKVGKGSEGEDQWIIILMKRRVTWVRS